MSTEELLEAATILQRPVSHRDRRRFQCDLLGAAIHPTLNRIAYVESRVKKRWWSEWLDVSIKIHLWDCGDDRSIDIKSYNPFFGCEVEYLEWMGDEALLIYSEKHDTYACTFGGTWPPRFIEIEHTWKIQSGVLSYFNSNEKEIGRLSVPELNQLPF